MTPDVVVDVGNWRIKWGRCRPGAVVESVALPPESPEEWQRQLDRWGMKCPLKWALTGVHPAHARQLGQWLSQRGDGVRVIDDPRELPLRVALERPDHVGIDRLMDAVAANGRRRAGRPAVVIDAGSALTVDWLDGEGTFQGGAILPGFRLLAQSLHDYTALLPLIQAPRKPPSIPGQSTPAAMEAGIYWSAAGGTAALIAAYARRAGTEPEVYLTGGDAPALLPSLPSARHWPEMTLEGIRLTAEMLK